MGKGLHRLSSPVIRKSHCSLFAASSLLNLLGLQLLSYILGLGLLLHLGPSQQPRGFQRIPTSLSMSGGMQRDEPSALTPTNDAAATSGIPQSGSAATEDSTLTVAQGSTGEHADPSPTLQVDAAALDTSYVPCGTFFPSGSFLPLHQRPSRGSHPSFPTRLCCHFPCSGCLVLTVNLGASTRLNLTSGKAC